MKLKLITSAPSLPVTLSQAKSFYRVIGDEMDEDINRTISAATQKAEQITNRQLVITTYEGYLNTFSPSVKIPKPPLVSITKVEYINTAGERVPWADYIVDDLMELAIVYFNSYPSDVRDAINSVIFTFECGYEAVPDAIVSWILIYGATLFENRENIVIGTIVDITQKAYYDHLLDSYRVIPV